MIAAGLPPDIPDFQEEFVTTSHQIWLELQEKQARLSTNSTYIVVGDSHHNIYIDQPDIVLNAIRQLVEASK